jgi:hypothetical protein
MAENNPRVVFERLFGSSEHRSARPRVAPARDRSILDSVNARVRELQQTLGASDTAR